MSKSKLKKGLDRLKQLLTKESAHLTSLLTKSLLQNFHYIRKTSKALKYK